MDSANLGVIMLDKDQQSISHAASICRDEAIAFRTYDSSPEMLRDISENDVFTLIVDLETPGGDVFVLVNELQHRNVDFEWLAVTSCGEPDMIRQSFHAGAKDCLVKPIKRFDLRGIVLSMVDDVQRMTEWRKRFRELHGRFSKLSVRELEILIGVLEGKSSQQIAEHIGISQTTIDSHRSNIMKKLEARNVAEECLIAWEWINQGRPVCIRESFRKRLSSDLLPN